MLRRHEGSKKQDVYDKRKIIEEFFNYRARFLNSPMLVISELELVIIVYVAVIG